MTTQTKERELKQPRLDGMEPTKLEELCEKYVENKIHQANLKLERDQLSKDILTEMHVEKRERIVISNGGENYSFEIVIGEDGISCKKETRSPRPNKDE